MTTTTLATTAIEIEDSWDGAVLPDTARQLAAMCTAMEVAPETEGATSLLRRFLDTGTAVSREEADREASRLEYEWTYDAVGRAQRAASAAYLERMAGVQPAQVQHGNGDWGDSPEYAATRTRVADACGLPVRQRTEREAHRRAVIAAALCAVVLASGGRVAPHWLRRAGDATPDWGQALDADARRRQEAREEILRNAREDERLAALEVAWDAEWRHAVNRFRNAYGMTEAGAKEAATRLLSAMGW